MLQHINYIVLYIPVDFQKTEIFLLMAGQQIIYDKLSVELLSDFCIQTSLCILSSNYV